MNPSTELARAIVGALVTGGVRDVVLAPGSRSAPLALAAAAAERAGAIRLFVRVDERGAGYLAQGLARAGLRPTAVVCTSGTAVSNLLPAVTEASYAGVPLICVTADRPPEMRCTGANQTIEQSGIFGGSVRFAAELDSADETDRAAVDRAATLVAEAIEAATDPMCQGPVHLNVGLREPLVPDACDEAPVFPNPGAVRDAARTPPPGGAEENGPPLSEILVGSGLERIPARGVIILGDAPRPGLPSRVAELAAATGWPVLAEPSGNAVGPGVIKHFALLLADERFREQHRPDVVVTVGRFGLSRGTLALVRESRHHVAVAIAGRDVPDPVRTAEAVITAVPSVDESRAGSVGSGGDRSWLAGWQLAGRAVGDVITSTLLGAGFSGIDVARRTMAAARERDSVFIGPSRAVRDVQDFVPLSRSRPRILGNRGASGIDGLVSTAWGVAAGSRGRTFALIGDLGFLHDCNGLLAPDVEDQPPLTLVVADNNGGGIFSSLEPGRPEHAADFERVFGTPHGRDLLMVARSLGATSERVATGAELSEALARRPGRPRVIIADVQSRSAEADLRERIAREVSAALASARIHRWGCFVRGPGCGVGKADDE